MQFARCAQKIPLAKLTATTTAPRQLLSLSKYNNSGATRRQFSASKSGAKNLKRPRVKTAGGNVEGAWYTTSGARNNSLDMGRYGLKRLDYKTLDPPVWTIPPHPPTKSIQERVLFPLTLAITIGFGAWAYMNPEDEDMKDYWKRVETGQILVEDDDDDDDEWEYDDEEED